MCLARDEKVRSQGHKSIGFMSIGWMQFCHFRQCYSAVKLQIYMVLPETIQSTVLRIEILDTYCREFSWYFVYQYFGAIGLMTQRTPEKTTANVHLSCTKKTKRVKHTGWYVADNYDIVQLLIDNGANIEGSDLHFGRALHLAALKGHVRSAKLLLLAGKEFRSNFVWYDMIR